MFRKGLLIVVGLALAQAVLADAPRERLLTLADDTQLPVRIWPAAGPDRLLWLPPEYGISARTERAAAAIAAAGIEVWMADLHSAWFLAAGAHSLDQVPEEALLALLRSALDAADGRRVFLMAAGRGAAHALRMARAAQQTARYRERLGGIVLMHPQLYVRTPQGGEDADYLPMARAVNLPLYVIQPRLSSGHWRLNGLMQTLQEGGAALFAHSLADASDGFINRMDHTEQERRIGADFPRMLAQALALLKQQGPVRRGPPPLPADTAPAGGPRRQLLAPYAGEAVAPPLRLPDIAGLRHDAADLRGQVVLVNFWATWCPPCVEEIPSMQRLYRRLRPHGLEVLAVDVGEPAEVARAFLRDKAVDFPVLLDPDGSALKAWKVYAFPTSFVLDRGGRIRYAVFGAIAWDGDDVVRLLRALLDEADAGL